MPIWLIILLIAVAAAAVALLIVYFTVGKKMQKRQDETQAAIDQTKQTMDMLIIDKKKLPLKEAGLPKIVLEQAPKRVHNRKMPIVKAKAGGKIISLVADKKVFDTIPVKTNVKAEVSGIYLVGFRPTRGSKPIEPVKKE